MIKQLADWLDDRSGFREPDEEALEENRSPAARAGGTSLARRSRWRFMVQAFTGILLMTSYSPSSSMAWASVFYIKEQLWMGWFIRGVHHFAAQTLMVLLPFHLLQVVWAGAYRRRASSTGGSAWPFCS